MNLPTDLREPFRSTYLAIFDSPLQGGLEWRAVRALFREIGATRWRANGDLEVTRNGHVLVLRPPPSKDVGGPDEILELRRFIERSETRASGTASAPSELDTRVSREAA